jgi:tripartite-type tricarboxylate transporter receptor subunit TctC
MRQLPQDLMISLLRRRSLLLAAGAWAVAPAWAQSTTWNPTYPIKLVVPFPPGGATDTTARALVERLGQKLGQPVIVDNRAGAGGAIGAQAVYRAAPDGHTMLFASADVMVIAPHLYLKLAYKPLEFAAIGPTAGGGLVLVGRADLEAKTFPEVVELARKRELSFASWGSGSAGHL